MSEESVNPETAPVPEGRPAPMKKVSGLLVVSLFLSLSGFLGFLLLGPVAGLITAWFGRKKVKADPLLIGPRFATVCITISVACLVANVILGALVYDKAMWGTAASESYSAVLLKVQDREFDAAWELMSDEFKRNHDQAAFVKSLEDNFPGDGKIVFDETTFLLREEEIDREKLQEDSKVLFEEAHPPFEFTLPFRVLHRVKVGAELETRLVDIDFHMWVKKSGFGQYDARVLDLDIRPAPPEDEIPGKPAEDAPDDEPK